MISVTAFTQKKRFIKDGCDFLGDLHFNHGTDTIVIKANYQGYYKLMPLPVMKKLQLNKKLNVKDFRYSVAFIPLGCSKRFGNPCRDSNGKAMSMMNKLSIGQTVYLTCVVYQGYYNFPNELFYTIEKVRTKNLIP